MGMEVSKDRALKELHKIYQEDFGYDAFEWLKYALENDSKFIDELQEYIGKYEISVYLDTLLNREKLLDLMEQANEQMQKDD